MLELNKLVSEECKYGPDCVLRFPRYCNYNAYKAGLDVQNHVLVPVADLAAMSWGMGGLTQLQLEIVSDYMRNHLVPALAKA